MGGAAIVKKIFKSPSAPIPASAVVAPVVKKVLQNESTSTDSYDSRKTKAKGRSMTMMSGAKGITKTSSDYSLGKKSLLGIV